MSLNQLSSSSQPLSERATTTNFYIFRKLAPYDVKITMLARGMSVGNEIEYTDELTLGRSIVNRTLFSDSFGHGGGC